MIKELMLMDAQFDERAKFFPSIQSYGPVLSNIYESCADSNNCKCDQLETQTILTFYLVPVHMQLQFGYAPSMRLQEGCRKANHVSGTRS